MFRFILFLSLILSQITNAKELEKVSLQLQWLDQFQFAGYYIAKEKGFYKDVGLDVEIKKFVYGLVPTEEVIKKRATYGVGRSSLIIDKSHNKDITILAPILQSSPLVFLTTKKSKIKSVKDFVGKKIMATQDAISTASLYAMQNKFDIKSKDITLQEHSFNIDDLIKGKTDVMLSYTSNEPFLLEQKETSYNIIDPKNFGFDFYNDILFTSKDELTNNKQRALNFKDASLKGWEYAFTHLEESVDLILKKYNTQNKSKEALLFEARELKKLAYYQTSHLGCIDMKKIQSIYDTYDDMGLIVNHYNINDIVLENVSIHKIELSQKEKEYIKNNPIIKVHNESNWPPFNFQKNNTPMGFSIDFIELLADKVGIDIKYISGYSWSEYMNMLQTAKLDLIINIAKNKKREETIAFTKSFLTLKNAIYVTKTSNGFDTLDDLKGFSVAIPENFFMHSYIKKNYPDIKLVLVKDLVEALEMLSLSKVDAVVGKKIVIDYLIETNMLSNIKVSQYIEDEKTFSRVSIGSSLKDKILIDILQKAQDKVTSEEMKHIKSKWFGTYQKAKSDILPFTFEEKKYLKNKGKITICVNKDWLPYEGFIDNKLFGISADYIDIFEKKLSIPFEPIVSDSQEKTKNNLFEKKCDIRSTVAKKIDIPYRTTKKYISDNIVLVTKIESPFSTNLKNLSETIVLVKGFSKINRFVKKEYSNFKIIEVDTLQKALKLVVDDAVYGYIGLSLPASFKIQKNYSYKLKIANNLKTLNLGLGIVENDHILFSIMEKVIKNININEHKKIMDRWIAVTIEKPQDFTYLWRLLIIFGIVLFFISLFIWNLSKLKSDLKEQKEIFENLYSKSSDGVLLIENNKLVDCNESALKVLHYTTKNDLLGRDPSTLSPNFQPDGEDSVSKADSMIKIALKEGSHSFEWMCKKANGRCFWADIVLTKIKLNNKDIIHVVLRDIEGKKTTELAMETLNKTLNQRVSQEVEKNREKDNQMLAQSRLAQMGEMISMIAHQWRQPLGAINSTAINLKMKFDLNAFDIEQNKKTNECISYIYKELDDICEYVKTLSLTIDDFRNFYKPNKKFKQLLLIEPIQKALNIIASSLNKNNIEVKISQNSTKTIDMYEGELMQVFLNILKNAQDNFLEKTIQNKSIDIEIEDIDSGIIVTISDNGGGVPKEIISKIFDPYFSTKTDKNGTGLGLYMCKMIIEDHHGGYLNVQNEKNCAIFSIKLPNEIKQSK
jgi:signal transduction histidine kinase/ABC-type nitrate/sulfonate/bicarbonate transport system substrate-binding protein